MEKTIIGITGLSGSGKSSMADNLNDLLMDSTVLHIDKIHQKMLIENPKVLVDIYGSEILLDNGNFDHDIFISDPKKIDEVHYATDDMLVETIINIIKSLNNKRIILDYYALPKLKGLWDLCDYRILVLSDQIKREQEVIKRHIKNGRKPEAKLEIRDSFAPDYDLFNFDFRIYNNYDSSFYDDIKSIAGELNNKMYKEEYNKWLEFVSEEDKQILLNMNEEEIKDSFTGKLSFGTAGIRGIMGLGPNRLNIYNIGIIMMGYSKYLLSKSERPAVVIGYDTRNNSYKFATECALVLNANGIKTYLFKEIASTPLVSYATKKMNLDGGIVITSSHNEYIYNGLKIYNLFGGQLTPVESNLVTEYINDIPDYKSVKKAPLNNELFDYVNDLIVYEFNNENENVFINKDLLNEYGKDLKITYTSLHGTGIHVVPNILDKYKIKYNLVSEQCVIDSMFTYAPKPNPEIIDVWDLPIEYAKKNNSYVIIATDPDSDRVGIMYKENDEYKLLNGNMIGIIFLYYLINNSDYFKKYVVRSIVTTNLVDKICREHHIRVKEVLTGCKNIANEKINDSTNYLFGFEESLGYMFNIDVNDKNAFSSINMFLEILCYLKKNNMSLNDYINEIFTKYGYYSFKQIDIKPKNKDIFLDKLRKEKLFDFEKRVDYLKEDINNTNAIKFIINDNEYFMMRPSGTENKIKVYYFVNDSSKELSDNRLESLVNRTTQIFDKISK